MMHIILRKRSILSKEKIKDKANHVMCNIISKIVDKRKASCVDHELLQSLCVASIRETVGEEEHEC